MDVQGLWLFMIAGLLLNIAPEPDMGLIIGWSAQHGLRASAIAALSVGAVAFGVSAILMASVVMPTKAMNQ
jgi:threonine/homoserine/homoserine lactone efflux protein